MSKRAYTHLTAKPIAPRSNFQFETLYEHTHSELSLQQSKRDQLITIYIALISFIVPSVLSKELGSLITGLSFLLLAFVGLLFSIIIVRYRVYKECYWLACQTLTRLTNYNVKDINKNLVQSVFYHAIYDKYDDYLSTKKHNRDGTRKFRWGKLAKSNMFSAETLYFLIISIVVCVIAFFGVMLLLGSTLWYVSLAGALLLLFYLLGFYFVSLSKVFDCLRYPDDLADDKLVKQANEAFKYAFSKAWTLDFCADEESNN